MSAGTPSRSAAPMPRPPLPAQPTPEFEVVGVDTVAYAAAPTLRYHLRAREPSDLEIFTIALSVQVQLEPAMRTHDAETRARLQDLFGDPERWSTTTRSLLWSRLNVLVPSFRSACEFDLPAPLTYDLDLGVSKYLHALDRGDVPLTFHFSGSVVYRDLEGRVQIVQVPWAQCSFAMPISAWRAAMEEHYPGRGWVGVRRETLDRLRRHQADNGLLTLDAGITSLLDATEARRRAD